MWSHPWLYNSLCVVRKKKSFNCSRIYYWAKKMFSTKHVEFFFTMPQLSWEKLQTDEANNVKQYENWQINQWDMVGLNIFRAFKQEDELFSSSNMNSYACLLNGFWKLVGTDTSHIYLNVGLCRNSLNMNSYSKNCGRWGNPSAQLKGSHWWMCFQLPCTLDTLDGALLLSCLLHLISTR